MPEFKITTQHQPSSMSFVGNIGNHRLVMDANPTVGGQDLGPSPKHILLSSLAGCTGIDVVSLLHKMRVDFSDFEIITEADLTNEHPRVFTYINIIYRIKVQESDREKVQKAITLSEEKYCGISAMLRKNAPIHVSIQYL